MGKINRWWQRGDNVRDVMLLVQRLTPLNNIWFHLSLTNKTSLVYKFSFRWRGHKDANDDHVHEEGVEGVGDDCFLVTERLSDWWHRHFRDCLEWIVSRISDISHHHESYFTLRKSSSRTEPPLTGYKSRIHNHARWRLYKLTVSAICSVHCWLLQGEV